LQAERERTEALLQALTAREADAAPWARRVREQVQRVLEGEGAGSLADPEARWGHQRKDRPFFGYKAHVVTDETGFVLAAQVTPGHAADVEQARGLVEQVQAQGMRPRRLVADKAYDAAALREALVEQGVRPYIPRRTKAGRLEEQGFTYDAREDRWACPQGKRSLGKTPHARGGYLVYFSEKDCGSCPLAAQCLRPGERRKRLYWQPATDRYRPKGLKRALRVRKAIERTFGEGKQWHGMGRSRYCGRARTAVQVLLTCMVIDAKKMARRLAGKNPKRRKPRSGAEVAA
jgi:IS5 family transposase